VPLEFDPSIKWKAELKVATHPGRRPIIPLILLIPPPVIPIVVFVVLARPAAFWLVRPLLIAKEEKLNVSHMSRFLITKTYRSKVGLCTNSRCAQPRPCTRRSRWWYLLLILLGF
jgi:hypothetical protein